MARIGTIETSWGHPASHGFSVATEIIGVDGPAVVGLRGDPRRPLATAEGDGAPFDPLGNRGFRAEIGAFVDAIRPVGRRRSTADEALQRPADGTGRARIDPDRAAGRHSR